MLSGIVFPCSSTVSLEIISSLNNQKNINLIGINSHNNYEFKNLFPLTYNNCPDIHNEDECINYIIDISIKHKCNFVIPTMDYSHLILSKYIDIFTKNNIKIISSSYETNQICVSKETTYATLRNIIDCPIEYDIDKINDNAFPLFLKPKIGYGSRNCMLIKSNTELQNNYNPSMLILEFLTGDEYTIDCFTSNNMLLYFHIRQRVLYKNGLSVITKSINKDHNCFNTIKTFAEKINDTIKFDGAWFFQVKYNKDNICKLLEISTRIAGASSINRMNNCNLSLLSIYHHFKYPIKIVENNDSFEVCKFFRNHINFNSIEKYKNIYIDLDDTLIVNSKVNIQAISFLYKCLNNNKNIYLISRHKGNINETLNNYKINSNIFTKIIHITDNSKKSNYMIDYSIFIDDSFRERNDVNTDRFRERYDICNLDNVLILDVDSFEFF
jgi:hypothetical protein